MCVCVCLPASHSYTEFSDFCARCIAYDLIKTKFVLFIMKVEFVLVITKVEFKLIIMKEEFCVDYVNEMLMAQLLLFLFLINRQCNSH